jgi:quercetin dioxygenase-like cupin family protein
MAGDHQQATATVQIDDGRVRVTEWRFRPGEATGHHRHEYDYVVVPITTGELTLVEQGVARVAPITAGQAYARPAGVEHDVVNESAREVVFVEVELTG